MARFGAAAVVLAVALTLLGPAAASAQSAPGPDPSPAPSDVAGRCPGGVSGVICDLEHSIVDGVVHKITGYFTLEPLRRKQAASIRYWLGVLDGALQMPDITGNARARELWLLCLAIANAFFVLLLIGGGVSSMAWEATHLEPKDVVPRFALAWVLANLSVLAVGAMIAVTNALTHALGQTTPHAMELATNRVLASGALPFLFPGAVSLLSLFIVGVRIFIIILVLLLTIAGGPIHLFAVFPHSAGITKSWWKAQAALMASGPVMMLIVAVGVWVLFTGTPLISASTVVDAFELLVLFFLLAAIPLWMLSRALKPVHHAVRDYKALRGAVALAKVVIP